MSQTYSTVKREMAAGRVYSTQRTAGPPPPAQRPQPSPPPLAQPEKRYRFRLAPIGLPGLPPVDPGAAGLVSLVGRPGEPYQVEAELQSRLPVHDPAIQPVLWLIHDLAVPADLAPEDLAALPRGASGGGNQPGGIFTHDGEPPTYGPRANGISIVVSPGRFTPAGPGSFRLQASLDPASNQTFHPLFFAGPQALADMNATLPSGTTAQILTDLFMRPATVHPELPLTTSGSARLWAVVNRHLEPGRRETLLDGSRYTRAAVTLEGIVRATPTALPTPEASLLVGMAREEE